VLRRNNRQHSVIVWEGEYLAVRKRNSHSEWKEFCRNIKPCQRNQFCRHAGKYLQWNTQQWHVHLLKLRRLLCPDALKFPRALLLVTHAMPHMEEATEDYLWAIPNYMAEGSTGSHGVPETVLSFFLSKCRHGPPLWSSGQSSWLKIQRSGFDSRGYQIFWEVMGLERGPLSLVSTADELLGRKSSGSGLEKSR
jgi:hypothetical protein